MSNKRFLPSLSDKNKKTIISIYSEEKDLGEAELIDHIHGEINRQNRRFKDSDGKPPRAISLKVIRDAVTNIEKLVEDLGRESFKNSTDKKIYIEKRYAELASKLRREPEIIDLERIGITRARFRVTHGTISNLKHDAKLTFPSYFGRIYEFSDVFNDLTRQWIQNAVSQNDIFSVYGVTSAPIVPEHLETVLKFHEIEGGLPIFIPMVKRLEDIDDTIIDLFKKKKCIIAFEDVVINDNFKVKYVDSNEKSLNVISGFSAMEPHTSAIFAGIAQRVQMLPTRKGHHPRVHLSTGTICSKHYRSSINHNLTPDSSSIKKAETKHFPGGFLIEKLSEKTFIPTQIMFDKKNSFTIYGRNYSKDGLKKAGIASAVWGDIHEDEHDKYMVEHSLKYSRHLRIKSLNVHDIFNCSSVSHWNDGMVCLKSYMSMKGLNSLSGELNSLARFFDRLTDVFEKVYVVDSNHDDMLRRAFDKGSVLKDPQNSLLSALLLPAGIFSYFERDEDGLDIGKYVENTLGIKKKTFDKFFGHLSKAPRLLEHAMHLYDVQNPDKIVFLDLESEHEVAGFDLSNHGHKGSGGAKGSIATFIKTFLKAVYGHTHTPAQENYVLYVGHNIDMRPGKRPIYAQGGTGTWALADVLINENMTAHHVFTIKGQRSRFLRDEVLENYSHKKLRSARSLLKGDLATLVYPETVARSFKAA